jgi:hypothetical protein
MQKAEKCCEGPIATERLRSKMKECPAMTNHLFVFLHHHPAAGGELHRFCNVDVATSPSPVHLVHREIQYPCRLFPARLTRPINIGMRRLVID